MIHIIESRSNPKVKALLKDKDRYFFFEGEKLVRDILDQHIDISILIIDTFSNTDRWNKKRYSHLETWHVSGAVMSKLSSLKEQPRIIAVVELKERPVNWQAARVVIGLDHLQDPGNAGTVFRCAASFGIDGVVLTGSSVKLNNNKFLRASQNALFNVPFQRMERVESLIDQAENAGLNIYLTSSHSPARTLTPQQLETPCLILLGNEGSGLDTELFKRFSTVTIPQSGKMESLNAGVSACILMYELHSKHETEFGNISEE